MLIAIAGTLGAGKGTIAQYLAGKHNFLYLSVRAFFAAELAKEGKAITRANIKEVAAKMRGEHGPIYPIEQLLNNSPKMRNMVIESIWTVHEVEYLKTRGDALWLVDADIKTRYERIKVRGLEMDKVSFEQFAADEKEEMSSTNPDMPSLSQLKELASFYIDNNSTKDELFAQVEKALLATSKISA